MNIQYDIFFISLAIFIWLLSAWEALSQMSPGKVRRLYSKNKMLADKLENWLEVGVQLKIILRIFCFCSISVVVATALPAVAVYVKNHHAWLPTIPSIVIAVLALAIVSEILAKILVLYLDLLILNITIPVVNLFRVTLLFPVVILLRMIQRRIEDWQQQRGSSDDDDRATTEDEIMSWVEKDDDENGEGPSPLEEDEKRMIRGIFDLDDTPVREIMTPRVDMTAMDVQTSIEDAKREFVKSGHSRIPVYDGTIDEIRGIIYAKDFLTQENTENKTLEQLAHRPIFIPETKAVGDLLDEVKKTQNHFAVVIDEYGGTSGIITLEDIIEEIVGEIRDEYDSEEDAEPEPINLPDGSYEIDARTLICDVNDMLDTDLPEDEDVDTIGGLVCGELGHIPVVGEKAILDEMVEVTILKADRRKILKLKIKVTTEDNE